MIESRAKGVENKRARLVALNVVQLDREHTDSF